MYTGNTRVSVFSDHDCIIRSDSSSSSTGNNNSSSSSSSKTGTGSRVGIYCKCMELYIFI